MFNKLLVATVVMAASSSIAFAGAGYKGERDLKAEMPPCPTYQYTSGPYIGLSVGPRVNYTGTPTTYVGIEGTLSLGYGMMLSPSWYLAAELLGADSAQIKDYRASTPGHGGVRSSWSWGGSVIPGVMVTDYTLGYIRLGGVSTRFMDQGSNKGGWQVGLGGQTAVAPNWDLRGEYVYTGYSSVSGIGKPNGDQFNLGVTYKFL